MFRGGFPASLSARAKRQVKVMKKMVLWPQMISIYRVNDGRQTETNMETNVCEIRGWGRTAGGYSEGETRGGLSSTE